MLKAQVMATSQEASNILQIPSPIEKTAALPTGRPPLMAFVADAKTEAVLRECLPQSPETPHVVMRGGIAKAIQHLAGERSPLTLIVDLSGVDLPVARVHDLADVCEPRVTVIALGDHNDVDLLEFLGLQTESRRLSGRLCDVHRWPPQPPDRSGG